LKRFSFSVLAKPCVTILRIATGRVSEIAEPTDWAISSLLTKVMARRSEIASDRRHLCRCGFLAFLAAQMKRCAVWLRKGC
jgi:hypothetical protein